jgi:hypothetical protein
MANETVKVLLMVMLLGGIRTAMFVADISAAQWQSASRACLDWLAALLSPAMSGETPRAALVLARRVIVR